MDTGNFARRIDEQGGRKRDRSDRLAQPAPRVGHDRSAGQSLLGQKRADRRSVLALIDKQNRQDRKSVVEGKSVSVSVDLGGRRIITKKKKDSSNEIKIEARL